jgi:hypothetical protein
MVALQTAEGAALLYAAIPPLFSIGALVASTSRGAILALAFALALAGLGLRRARGVPVWAMALAFAAFGLAGMSWYREAHNDYVQVLVETGIPGLLIALWAALAVLAAARSDPWLLAALAGVLLHELVDFDLQIPALAVLFATLCALGGRGVAREPA